MCANPLQLMTLIMIDNAAFKELFDARKAAQQGVGYMASSVMNWTS